MTHPNDTNLAAKVKELLQSEESLAFLRQQVKALGLSAVPIVIQEIRQGQGDGKFMERAILLLGEIGGNDAADVVASFLDNQDEMLKAAALTALRQIGNPGNVPAVTALLNDRSDAVRKEAIKTLAKLGNASSLPALKEIAQSEDRELLKEQVQSAIAEIEERDV